MEFGLVYSAEQERFRAEVAEWLDANVPGDINARPGSQQESYQLYLRQARARPQARGQGLALPVSAAGVRRRRSGLRLGHRAGGGVAPASASGCRPTTTAAACWARPSIRVWGTEEQKELFLPPIYRGEVTDLAAADRADRRIGPGRGPDHGDPGRRRVRPERPEDLRRQQSWLPTGIWVIAVTDPGGKRHHNLSWFMIDSNLPGITIQPQYLLCGQRRGLRWTPATRTRSSSRTCGFPPSRGWARRTRAGGSRPPTWKSSTAGAAACGRTRSGPSCWSTAGTRRAGTGSG